MRSYLPIIGGISIAVGLVGLTVGLGYQALNWIGSVTGWWGW